MTPNQTFQSSPVRGCAAGDTVAGRYLLEKNIGEGGMGTVWLAKNVALDVPIALKLIRAGFESEEARARLLEEARAAAKIEHPAVVRVFDFGQTELGDPYIVMELLDGHALSDAMADCGSIDPVAAVRTLLPIVDGLACAHEAGVVHRDLKPSNIFLAWERNHLQPKVVDFGIAKTERVDTARKLTLQGTVLGSPAYMAPEQARGLEDVDLRADIWTICVVLYECVTGSAAFSGPNYNALMRSVIEDEVVAITERGVDDPALSEILSRGLAKDREQRWQSMGELGTALAAWLWAAGVTEDITGASLGGTWLSPAVMAWTPQRSATASGLRPMEGQPTEVLPRLEVRADGSSTHAFVADAPTRSGGGRLFSTLLAALVGVVTFVITFGVVRAWRDEASSPVSPASATDALLETRDVARTLTPEGRETGPAIAQEEVPAPSSIPDVALAVTVPPTPAQPPRLVTNGRTRSALWLPPAPSPDGRTRGGVTADLKVPY